MTIEPLHKSRVVEVAAPLPPAWLRRGETVAPSPERLSADVLQSGLNGELRGAIVASIDAAKEVVQLVAFLLSDTHIADALLRATERGVRVYVLTASETRLQKVVDEEGFERRMLDEHKELLDRLAGKVLVRSGPQFHAKFLVVDPRGEATGWLCTANFNKALTDSVEIAVRLRPDEARVAAGWFNVGFWSEAERELAQKGGRLAKVTAPPAKPQRPAAGSVVVTSSGVRHLAEAVTELVDGASELLVATYGLAADHPSVRAVEARARAGAAVTVLTRPRPAVAPGVTTLEEAGARVLAHDKLHAKAIATPDRVLVMSANLEAHGLDSGFEIGLLLSDDRAQVVRELLRAWTDSFPWAHEAAGDRTQHEGELCLDTEGLRTGVRRVVEQKTKRLPPVTAPSALDLEAATEPKLTLPADDTEYPRRWRFEWDVVPPKLPKGAKELKETVEREVPDQDGKTRTVNEQCPYSPPAFRRDKQTFVLLGSMSEAGAARKLAEQLGARVVVR